MKGLDLEGLGSRWRAIVVSHQSWATSILAGLAAYNIITSEKTVPIISEASPVHRPSIISFLEKKGVEDDYMPLFTSFPFPEVDKPVILHSIGFDLVGYHDFLRKHLSSIRVVFTHANKGLSTLLHFPLVRLVNLRGRKFKVYLGRGDYFKVIEITEKGVVEPEKKGDKMVVEAYNVLLEAMMNYGSLTVKDGVFVLQGQLGVDSNKARELIGVLVNHGKLSVRKGLIEIK